MPFREPYNSYYPAVFKPALEAAGYTVARADDVFTPRPIMLDVQKCILDADLVLCEMSERNPNVFYELGLSHAIGRPAILVSRKEEDVPFDLRHVRVIVYDYSLPGWETKLKEAITKAAQAVTDSTEIWPPPLTARQDQRAGLRTLTNEIGFNLSEIDTFLANGYAIDDSGRVTANGKSSALRYVTCMTSQFESSDVQRAIASVDNVTRDELFGVYRGFREINTRAEALKQAFLPWRASQYFEAVNDFQTHNRATAEKLIGDIAKATLA